MAAYEVRPRDVVLYFRGMASSGVVSLSLDVVAAFPGSYTGDASRAYAYYGDEHKAWAAGMHVDISPASA